MSEVEQVIDIRDPEINVEELMNQIRERIQQRQLQFLGQKESKTIDSLILTRLSEMNPENELRRLRMYAGDIWATPVRIDRHFRIFNSTFGRIENLLHHLLLKYVNMLAGRQIAFNIEAAEMLSNIMASLEEYDTNLRSIEKRLSELETNSTTHQPS